MVFCLGVPYTLNMKPASQKNTVVTSKAKMVLGTALILCVGGVVGWFGHRPVTNASTGQTKLVRENSANYKFINPIVLAQVPENTSVPQFQSLKKSITNYINNDKVNNTVIDASVYFRQLNTDDWVGVNVDDMYAPASMLKVVSLIGFLQAEEQNPTLLQTQVTISPQSINTDSNQDHYAPAETVQLGHTYSTEELLSRMIIDSDNNAAFSLDQITGNDLFDKTYSDLTIPNPNKTTAVDFMSPKMFSRVFRVLYNGSYLTTQDSEQALDLLSKTTFTQGLVAGVPSGIVVAHKFGERTISVQDATNPANNDVTNELHDCGIIYAPNDPYLLCVMTKGADFDVLQKVISDISGMAWNTMQQMDAIK